MREVHVVGAGIVDRGRVLAAQRGPGMSLPGRWEFPGGKVEPGEDPRSALVREIREELGLEIEVAERLGTSRVGPPGRRIRLEVYRAHSASLEITLLEHARVLWLGPEELDRFDWAPADLPFLPRIRAILSSAVGPPARTRRGRQRC